MTHNKLQKKVTELLTVRGNGFSMVSSNRRGRPDIAGHIGVISIFIECKVGKDTLRPAQRTTLLDINRKKGIGIQLHEKHWDIFEAYVKRIEDEIDKYLPCNLVGMPIPEELVVTDHTKVAIAEGFVSI